MQQNKMIPVALWFAGLTIAAYVLAQAAVMIMSGSFDAALVWNAPTVAQNLSESSVLLPHLDASGRNKAARVPNGYAGSGVKVEQVSDTRWILEMVSLPPNIRDLPPFLMQASAVPYVKRGRTAGFRINGISRGGFYEKIGLRNGDVLLRVNMQKLDDPVKLLSLYQEMRSKRHISILLFRSGQDQTFEYDIR
jgi:type II secretory pathway component PulC